MPAFGPFNPGSSSAGALVQISRVVLGSASPSVTFTSIPQTYNSLILKIVARGSGSNTNDSIFMTFNSDSGSNYSFALIQNNGGSSSPYAASTNPSNYALAGVAIGSTSITSAAGGISTEILGYRSGVYYPTVISHTSNPAGGSGSEVILNFLHASQWRSLTAISTIALVLGSGSNFSIGSTFTLYGVN